MDVPENLQGGPAGAEPSESAGETGCDIDDGGRPDPYVVAQSDQPLFIVISGPSGVGKDAVLRHMKELRLPFHFVVTATSRPPRDDETHGVDYYFVSQADFGSMLAHGELLEHAEVYGKHYGIPKQQVRDALASGLDVVLRVDVQGAATIRRLVPEAVLIFLMTATEEELAERLRARGTENEDDLCLRIAMARQELERLGEFDYVVVNRCNQLDETVQRIRSIICAEKCRVVQRRVNL